VTYLRFRPRRAHWLYRLIGVAALASLVAVVAVAAVRSSG
jgi:hypothetical protein